MPRPGAFAALTVLTATSSPVIYYGTGAAGLSYFIALVAVPAVAALGVLRSGRGSPRDWDYRRPLRRRASLVLAWAAVPSGLLVDVAVRRVLDVDASSWLGVAAVVHIFFLVAGILAVVVLRRLTSTRAVLAALGTVAAGVGVSLVVVIGSVGLVLATAPLLLVAAAAYPPAASRPGLRQSG